MEKLKFFTWGILRLLINPQNDKSLPPQTIYNIQYKTLNAANPCSTQSHSDLHLVVTGPTRINIVHIKFA